ncbi:MAG: GtrA family protein [Chloroflexota bacterium]|nr:GtrA family protein [Chloroflexota bacterium]
MSNEKVITQLVKYALVGAANTLIDAAAYYALTRWLGLESLPVLAKSIAYAIGMVNSFYCNRTWTFRSRSNPWPAVLLFIPTHIAALGINAGVMALMYNNLDWSEVIALGVATGASFGWNFFLNRCFVFKN